MLKAKPCCHPVSRMTRGGSFAFMKKTNDMA